MNKNIYLDNVDTVERAAGALDGIAAELNCIAYSLTSREGEPTRETLEGALFGVAAYLKRISDDITTAAGQILGELSKEDRKEGQH